MNAVVREIPIVEMNPAMTGDELAALYQSNGRVHVKNFLPYRVADALARHLVESMSYRTCIVANEEEMATPPGDDSVLGAEEERELYDLACEGARNGFASFFEVDHLASQPYIRDPARVTTAYDACVDYINSAEFVEFARGVTGIAELIRSSVQATRFRSGHFMLFNSGTRSADPSGKRRVNFELNLTRQWRPEWGGLLEMRGHDGHQIEGVLPCFNSLDLFTFPRGYWISQVTPFAAAARYAISGSLYVE